MEPSFADLVVRAGRAPLAAAQSPPPRFADASFGAALAALHPLRYTALVVPLARLLVRDLRPIPDEPDALRFVHFVDKLYDRDVAFAARGCAPDELFAAPYAVGPFADKYARCRSRLAELLA